MTVYDQSGAGLPTATGANMLGIFGSVNNSTTFGAIRDGLSNTIAAGEVQRITTLTPLSVDGWSVGGCATLFTTGEMRSNNTSVSSGGKMMNNGGFGSPGSDHSNGANFAFADGSVTFFSDSMDPLTFSLMGSMADGMSLNASNRPN
jgi:prepilin-type processing-associated H-X9-DG protein